MNPSSLASEFELIVLCRYSLYSFKAEGEICQLQVVFSCGPKHMCAVVQPFSPSGMDGEVILVRWGKMADSVPKEKVYKTSIPVKRGKGLQSQVLC